MTIRALLRRTTPSAHVPGHPVTTHIPVLTWFALGTTILLWASAFAGIRAALVLVNRQSA